MKARCSLVFVLALEPLVVHQSVTTWRIVFAVSSLILFFPIVIYFVMGVALPVAKKKDDISKIEEVEVKKELGGNVDKIEVELEKIKEMRDKNLISEEEFQSLRNKTLGL